MVVLLQRGQRDCAGNVAAPHAPHWAPISFGSSSGQVNTSAMGFCISEKRSLTSSMASPSDPPSHTTPRSRLTVQVRRDVLVDRTAYRLLASRAKRPDPDD